MVDAHGAGYRCPIPMKEPQGRFATGTFRRLCNATIWPWPEADAVWALFGVGQDEYIQAMAAVQALADASPWDQASQTWVIR